MAISVISASTAASTGEDVSMEAQQRTENVSPQARNVMVTGNVKLGGGKVHRVRMNKERLHLVLTTLNVNTHLVKMFFTYGQKMKACTELRAIMDAQARLVGKQSEVPSVDVRCTVPPAAVCSCPRRVACRVSGSGSTKP
jgi:hypothetical protein